MRRTAPTVFERRLSANGVISVAGVDEVGRGCLAGPVLAAAVILPFPCPIVGINDSKQLTASVRERLCGAILRQAIAYGVGVVDSAEIDTLNIGRATRKAMQLAVAALSVSPGHLLIDGSQPIAAAYPQTVIVKGDCRSISVAAASIIAKVTRDRMMVAYERQYPAFCFSRHKGYGTARHLAELAAHGPTPLHRRSFSPVRRFTG